jgi:hypothetical protein
MKRRITRRDLVVLAAAVPAAGLPSAAQPPPPIPSSPEEDLKAALAQFKSSAGRIAKVDLPMSTEPAVHFKA